MPGWGLTFARQTNRRDWTEPHFCDNWWKADGDLSAPISACTVNSVLSHPSLPDQHMCLQVRMYVRTYLTYSEAEKNRDRVVHSIFRIARFLFFFFPLLFLSFFFFLFFPADHFRSLFFFFFFLFFLSSLLHSPYVATYMSIHVGTAPKYLSLSDLKSAGPFVGWTLYLPSLPFFVFHYILYLTSQTISDPNHLFVIVPCGGTCIS